MSDGYLAAEARGRVAIDRELAACGWVVQDRKDLNLYAGPGWRSGSSSWGLVTACRNQDLCGPSDNNRETRRE